MKVAFKYFITVRPKQNVLQTFLATNLWWGSKSRNFYCLNYWNHRFYWCILQNNLNYICEHTLKNLKIMRRNKWIQTFLSINFPFYCHRVKSIYLTWSMYFIEIQDWYDWSKWVSEWLLFNAKWVIFLIIARTCYI